MKDSDSDSVDPAAHELLEFIKKSRRETPLPAFKEQFLSGYNLPDEETAATPKITDSAQKDEPILKF